MLIRNLFLVLVVVAFVGCGNKQQAEQAAGQDNTDYIKQGMDYLAKADVAHGLQSFDQAIRRDPTNVENYLVLGQVYLRLKVYEKAEDTLKAASKIAPTNGDVYYFLALSQNFQGPQKKEKALESAKKSAELFVQSQQKDRFQEALSLVKGLSQENVPSTNFSPR